MNDYTKFLSLFLLIFFYFPTITSGETTNPSDDKAEEYSQNTNPITDWDLTVADISIGMKESSVKMLLGKPLKTDTETIDIDGISATFKIYITPAAKYRTAMQHRQPAWL